MGNFAIIAGLAICSLGVNAQEGFKAGINLGLPVGDAGDVSGFSIGVDALYHWAVADSFIAGIAIGITNAFGKNIYTGIGSIDITDVPGSGLLKVKAQNIMVGAAYMF